MKGNMDILTKWFTPKQNPVHIGVYQTRNSNEETQEPWVFGFQYWDGEGWGRYSFSKERAEQYKYVRAYIQKRFWRGLVIKP